MDKQRLLGLFDISIQMSEQAQILFEPNVRVSAASEDSSEFGVYTVALNGLKQRIAKDEIFVLIAGEVKAGKSTFINTLVGRKICSTAQEVCTNVCTMVRYGNELKVFVYFYDENGKLEAKEIDETEIPEFTTESLNPKNEKKVSYIEVQVPSKVLSEGIVLIDTPGLGALDPKHVQKTFEMAKLADVIFFLGNTDKELTSYEVASLSSLIEVSKTRSVAHILTCCDRGDKETIAFENDNKLKELIPSLKIPVLQVSSLMYHKYLKTNTEAFLEYSGFRKAMAFIYSVSKSKDDILCHLGSIQLKELLNLIRSKIESYKAMADNPHAYDDRLSELNSARQKLEELIQKQSEWKKNIQTNVNTAKANLIEYRETQKAECLKHVKKLLEEATYRSDKNALTTAVQAKLTSSIDTIQTKLRNELVLAFNKAKKTSHLDRIEQVISCCTITAANNTTIEYVDEKAATKAMRYGRNIVSAAGIGSLAAAGISQLGATALGAKIGGVIGSVFPGLGTLIGVGSGALLGAIAGLLYSLFETTEQKKKRLYEACASSINQFFTKAAPKIDEAFVNSVNPLQTQFLENLNALAKVYNSEIAKLSQKRDIAQAHMKEVEAIIDILSDVINALPSSEAA